LHLNRCPQLSPGESAWYPAPFKALLAGDLSAADRRDSRLSGLDG